MAKGEFTRQEVAELRKAYPPGTRIELSYMDDPFAVASGTRGTVEKVDGMGNVYTKWDNGRTLSAIPGVDSFRKLTEQEVQEERQLKTQEQGEQQWQTM